MADEEIREPTADEPGLPAEISRSLASVWNQYAGERPTDAATDIRGNRIECVLSDSVRTLNDRFDAAQADDDPGTDSGRPRTRAAFRNDAIAAVGRATGRRVVAFVSDHDAERNVATEVFLLDSAPRVSRDRVALPGS
ncbi:MAG TPA: Na-translocating system protein MpsC family protein [Solirubrobacterales bacterium]|nr:Na-translocating system protein MpsC family protein [Solirubrobacterales bacterium]